MISLILGLRIYKKMHEWMNNKFTPRTVYTLVPNTKQRGVGDLFKRGLMAAFMLKMLGRIVRGNCLVCLVHYS